MFALPSWEAHCEVGLEMQALAQEPRRFTPVVRIRSQSQVILNLLALCAAMCLSALANRD